MKVKEMLMDRPFREEESLYSLSKRMLVWIDCDLSYPDLPSEQEVDLVRLKTAIEEIIKYENLDSRV